MLTLIFSDVPSSSIASSSKPSAVNPAIEHQRVFGYQPKTNVQFQPTGKKRGKGKMQPCTLKFYCLGEVNQEKPPTTIGQKAMLSNCGLGPGNITVDISTPSIHEHILSKFPRLNAAGGYELLLYQRGGDERGFHRLPLPYSAARIKEVAGTQAMIYVRPLQTDIIDLEEDRANFIDDIKEVGNFLFILLYNYTVLQYIII